MKDVKGIKRYLFGYEKEGIHRLVLEYPLNNVGLLFLQNLFNVDSGDQDAATRDMIYCYNIDEMKAKVLQPFVNKKIDLDKYIFQLGCYADE